MLNRSHELRRRATAAWHVVWHVLCCLTRVVLYVANVSCCPQELIRLAKRQHSSCADHATAALRDLGCKVELREEWKGGTGGVKHEMEMTHGFDAKSAFRPPARTWPAQRPFPVAPCHRVGCSRMPCIHEFLSAASSLV